MEQKDLISVGRLGRSRGADVYRETLIMDRSRPGLARPCGCLHSLLGIKLAEWLVTKYLILGQSYEKTGFKAEIVASLCPSS